MDANNPEEGSGMRHIHPYRHPSRSLAWLSITCLCLACAACSGNAGPLLADCPPGMVCYGPVAPVPVATPEYVTTQVGSPVTFHAVTLNVSTPGLTYQWARSSDAGAHYTEIPGATTDTLTLAAPNLADDATDFRVTASESGLSGAAVTHLAVSASPGVVFQDGEFALADWVATPLADGSVPAPIEAEQAPATGGFPGAYRSMAMQFAPTFNQGSVVHASLPSTWDPSTQGAVHVIDYAEDGIAQTSTAVRHAEAAMLLEQAGRRYVSDPRNSFHYASVAWSVSLASASLRAQDFHLIDGPACGAGESCPDFSSAGASMRFGYWRRCVSTTDTSFTNGIDNWKVTVWKR